MLAAGAARVGECGRGGAADDGGGSRPGAGGVLWVQRALGSDPPCGAL